MPIRIDCERCDLAVTVCSSHPLFLCSSFIFLQCFFSLSLPAYTSAAALRSKLLYAMESCTSMDGDLVLKNSELYDYSADDVK